MIDIAKVVPWVITGSAVLTGAFFVVQSSYETNQPLEQFAGERCADVWNGSPLDLVATFTHEDYDACTALDTGSALASLNAVSVQWDEACVTEAGWMLTDDATGHLMPVATSTEFNMRADVGHCARLVATAEQCADFEKALDRGEQGWAILRTLGCSARVETS